MYNRSVKPSTVSAFFICLGMPLLIGFTAGLFTRPQIAGWYALLHKPSFNPPNEWFAPVWTVLYILIGLAAFFAWQKRQHAAYKNARAWYIAQLALNFSWSAVFFGLHSIAGGLTIISLLWVCILVNLILFGKISRPAQLLMVPYLVWVSFAWLLNMGILFLN